MCSGQKQGGYLVEGNIPIEERWLTRGNWLVYRFGVKQRQKEIIEVVTRHVRIPFDSNIKGKASKPPQHTAVVCL